MGPSIDEATLTFVRTVKESPIQPHPSQEQALNAFSVAFQKWNPRTLIDIQSSDKGTIDVLFAATHHACHHDYFYTEVMRQRQVMIGYIVAQWNRELTKGILTTKDLQAAMATIDVPPGSEHAWESYNTYYQNQQARMASMTPGEAGSLKLYTPTSWTSYLLATFLPPTPQLDPSTTTVASAVATSEIETPISSPPQVVEDINSPMPSNQSLEREEIPNDEEPSPTPTPAAMEEQSYIHLLTAVPSLPSVEKMKQEIENIKHFKNTIRNYTHVHIRGISYSLSDLQFPVFPFLGSLGSMSLDSTEKVCTLDLQRQLINIQATIGENPDFLYLHFYFLQHSSILYVDMISQNGPTSYCNTVDESCQRIKDAFGQHMNYAGVATAMKLLTKDDDLNAELKVLINCNVLGISALDITIFRSVQLLIEMSKPLQDFIQCCELFQFQAAESDVSFRALQTEVATFYSAKSNDRQSCLYFFNRLHDLLCTSDEIDTTNTETAGPYIAFLQKISHLKSVLTALVPLAHARHGPELIQCFRDMKWLNTSDDDDIDGLQTFYRDEDMLSDILSNHDGTSIESWMPVVGLFYLVERRSSCQRLCELVTDLRNDTDIQTVMEETKTISDDILNLNHLIRFIYGIDGLRKLLRDISTPLQDFVQCCVMYKFHVVDNDASFRSLQAEVATFYFTKTKDRHTSLAFLDRLYCTLCTVHEVDGTDVTPVEPSIPLLRKISHLKGALTAFVPLAYVLKGPKLRDCFREMGWLEGSIGSNGSDGLQAFYEDCKTLTDILSKYDAANESVIIDSLMPVVRLCYFVDRHSQCPHIYELISALKNDTDVQTTLQETSTIKDDIHDLNDRINFVKDLFQYVCHPEPTSTLVPTKDGAFADVDV